MSILDLLKAWDEAAQRAMESGPKSQVSPEELKGAAGLCLRSGLLAGSKSTSDEECFPGTNDTLLG